MGVSFKVSKKGTRFRPKFKPESASVLDDNDKVDAPPQLPTTRKRSADDTEDYEDISGNLDGEISFIINIFQNGFSIGNPSEGNVNHQNGSQNDPKLIHPYDKASESLFAAIECGRLPLYFLEDTPFNYINGTVTCEVRDYRKDPCKTKISLKISLDNVVNDITQISNNAWTYGDYLEAESRILKALQPKLNLDPVPNLDRLCKETSSLKINLNIPFIRKKRLKQGQVAVNERSKLGLCSDVEEIEIMFDRFLKIRMSTEKKLQLNCKKNKVKEYKTNKSFSTRQLAACLFDDDNNDRIIKDEMCNMKLSKSVLGGSINVCKTRVLKFVQTNHVSQVGPKLETQLVLSEKQSDGTVAMFYGEVDNCDYLVEELPHTLPNTHTADLLTAEFCSQMVREGYCVEGDDVQPKLITKLLISGAHNMPSGRMNYNGLLASSQQSFYHEQQQFQRFAQNPNIQLGNYQVLPQEIQMLRQQKEAHMQRKMMMERYVRMGQLKQEAANVTERMVQQIKTGVMRGHGGQYGNFSGLEGGNAQRHPGGSSSGVSMMGYGVNPYMDQQELLYLKQMQCLRLPPQHVSSPMPHQQPPNPMSPQWSM